MKFNKHFKKAVFHYLNLISVAIYRATSVLFLCCFIVFLRICHTTIRKMLLTQPCVTVFKLSVMKD